MKKKIVAIVILLIVAASQLSTAQLEASNWYFGFNAGITFDPVTGAVTPVTNGQLDTFEGCASISDSSGNLLFYTDGITVFDRNHLIMQNGQGLRGNPSSTQSAIIIPKPQDPDIYYIFTVDTAATGGQDSGLHWYEVDMTANLNQGAVVSSITNPNNLINTCSEKITAINHGVNDEILVTALAEFNGIGTAFDTFYTFTVSPTGIDPVPVKSQVATTINNGGRRGNLKISPDGQYMVSCNMGTGSFLYDYDQLTGIVSNERQLQFTGQNRSGYGVEFSPDSSLLYVSASNDANSNDPAAHSSTLFQFDMTSPNPESSTVVIDTRAGYRGSLQLGIDKKIYRALSDTYNDGRSFLGVINNPNVAGQGCNYVHDAIPLAGRLSAQGLPPFIQSFFALIDVEFTCLGDNTTFEFDSDTPPTLVDWDFGDGTNSSVESPTHVYAAPGIYNVVLTLTINGSVRTYRKSVQIFDTPIANAAIDVNVCDINNDGTESFDLTATATPQILGAQDATIFNVEYYSSQADADNGANPISLPYIATTLTQTLFARVSNNNNEDCYDTTSFDIEIFTQPVANAVNNLEVCDDDFDGFQTFDLSLQTPVILDSQSTTDFTVSYHASQADADSGNSPLATNYTNATAFNENIFARVVNINEASCVDTTSFDLIVNPKPVANDTNAFQCDEDGTLDSRTIFNLSEFDDTITSSATGVTVTYHINQNDADNNMSPLDNTSYTNTTPLQTVYARVTDDTTNCYTTSLVTLSVSASDAQDTILIGCDDDGLADGITTFNLSDADSSVLITAPSNVTLNYYASLNDALTEQNVLPITYDNTTPNSQIIFARAESPDGNCFGISEVELVVNDLPVIEPIELIDYCGNNPQPLTIDAGIITGSPSDYTYLWSTSENTFSIQVTTGGDYTVAVTDTNGCTSNRTVTVIISETATIDNIDVIHAGTSSNGTATANVSGLGNYEYRVSLEEPFQDSPIFDDLTPGFYTLYVRDKNGCGTVQQEFSVIGYPRYFTPNNDNYHDYWQLIGTSFMFEPGAQIFIFDRYGKLLKQIAADGVGWDGTYNGNPMPSSDYWFTATLMDGTTFSSHFTLKR
ncbi:T9SS type B sorting domain-containing protein [Nonlabens ulvanivorans]|uniref:T9SS type B sorting domain-containing protein n=1 Tax=Nonlabens ulvanivorans TaxID=906888 RepID=UPI0029429039|nr:T9SS type B sorting domain-containing protein [Nonlabens ulvanivorans]WOI23890.1 T9SS type B sorting domain-containing protein [Nonlabens ulvanivorans]